MSNPHRWVKVRWMIWAICQKCGLVALRNPLTQWCQQHGCDYDDHPGYQSALRTLTK